MYDWKEAEYPVIAGLLHFTTRDASGQRRYDRDRLVDWARERFSVDVSLDDLRNKEHEDIRRLLVEHSRTSLAKASEARAEAQRLIDDVFAKVTGSHEGNGHAMPNVVAGSSGASVTLQKLADRLHAYDSKVSQEELSKLERDRLENRATLAIDEHFRPEMRRMERALVLQILDAAWKDHLLAMDHLRSSVSLRSYAQVDPKVEYKREGMRTFDVMWNNIGDRVTDLIFRMEQLDENFVGSTWKETSARHDEAPPATAIGEQQQSAIDGSQSEAQKIEPIRNKSEKVGRNDPCPCGSGKKFKNCCMRKSGGQAA